MQKKCKFLVGALLAWIPVTAQAQFGGNVGFGGAASGRSASVVFDNPAGMIRWETEDYRLGFNGHAAFIFGLRRTVTEQLSVDFGYQYVDGKDAPIVSPGGSGQGTVSGEFGMQQWHSNAVGLFLNVTPQKKSAGG